MSSPISTVAKGKAPYQHTAVSEQTLAPVRHINSELIPKAREQVIELQKQAREEYMSDISHQSPDGPGPSNWTVQAKEHAAFTYHLAKQAWMDWMFFHLAFLRVIQRDTLRRFQLTEEVRPLPELSFIASLTSVALPGASSSFAHFRVGRIGLSYTCRHRSQSSSAI